MEAGVHNIVPVLGLICLSAADTQEVVRKSADTWNFQDLALAIFSSVALQTRPSFCL